MKSSREQRMSNSNDSFHSVFQICFDDAILKTFGKQHRHDFWAALAEVLKEKIIPQICKCKTTDIRWIKCKRFKDVVIFGFDDDGKDFWYENSKKEIKSLITEKESFNFDVFGERFIRENKMPTFFFFSAFFTPSAIKSC